MTAGTIFEGTRIALPVWFRAIWWMTNRKNGVRAMGLQRVLGLGSYETAWTWLHKLRLVMVRPGRDQLNGRVEVDETYFGGLEEGVRGRQTRRKALVVVAAQQDGKPWPSIRYPTARSCGTPADSDPQPVVCSGAKGIPTILRAA